MTDNRTPSREALEDALKSEEYWKIEASRLTGEKVMIETRCRKLTDDFRGFALRLRDHASAAEDKFPELAEYINTTCDIISGYLRTEERQSRAALAERQTTPGAGVEVERLRAALESVEPLLAQLALPSSIDLAVADGVHRLGERHGYGALMTCASAIWRERLEEGGYPSGGEFVVGPCRTTAENAWQAVREALAVRPTPPEESSQVAGETKLTVEVVERETIELMKDAVQRDGVPVGSWISLRMKEAVERAALSKPQPAEGAEEQIERLTRERDEALAFLDNAVSKAPEPLRALGEYLGRLLDEDQWPEAERYLNAALSAQSPAPADSTTGEGARPTAAQFLARYVDEDYAHYVIGEGIAGRRSVPAFVLTAVDELLKSRDDLAEQLDQARAAIADKDNALVASKADALAATVRRDDLATRLAAERDHFCTQFQRYFHEAVDAQEALEQVKGHAQEVVDCWGVGWKRHQLSKMIAAMDPLMSDLRQALASLGNPSGEGK